MNATATHLEDLLLDYAYGELSDAQSREVKAHLDGCAQCTAALAEIQGVRQVMSNLPEQAAPPAGLESLLAYAEQAARRVQAGPPPEKRWWKAWLVPVGGIATVAVIFVAGQTVLEREAPGAAADQAVMAALKSQKEEAAPATAVAFAEEAPASAPPPPPAAPVAAQAAEPEGKTAFVEAPRRAEVSRERRVEKKKASREQPAPELSASTGDADALVVGGRAGTRAPAAAGGAPAPAKKVAEASPPAAPPKLDSAAGYADDAREERAEAESMNVALSQKRVLGNRNVDVAADSAVDAEVLARAEVLSQQAWAAYREGDRAREAELLRQAVATGVTQAPLAPGLLNRLCDAEYALGNDAAAEAACARVLREFPGGPAAHMARRRILQERDEAARNRPAETASEPPSP